MDDTHHFHSLSINPPIPVIRLFQTLTLKLQGRYTYSRAQSIQSWYQMIGSDNNRGKHYLRNFDESPFASYNLISRSNMASHSMYLVNGYRAQSELFTREINTMSNYLFIYHASGCYVLFIEIVGGEWAWGTEAEIGLDSTSFST